MGRTSDNMPPPQAIVCHLCNGKYFKRSYPIHLKQCEEKWKKTHSRCEYCGSAVANHDWSDHRSHCKPKRSKKKTNHSKNIPLVVPRNTNLETIPALNDCKVTECEECETESAVWKCQECEQSLCAMCEVELHRKGSRVRHTRIPMNAKALRAENLSVLTQNDCKETECNPPQREPNKDHRSQCKFCSRRFNPDRVEKHMRICQNSKKKNKRRRIYDGAAKRVEGTVFEEFKYNRSSTPEKVKEWKKNGRRWRTESSQLRQIAGIHDDLKEIRKNNSDKKEEENDIMIKVPSKKPVFKKDTPSKKVLFKKNTPSKKESTSKISKSSKQEMKKKSVRINASSIKMGQRSSSNNTSNNSSVRGSARNSFRGSTRNSKQANSRDSSSKKKAFIPTFERKRSTNSRETNKNISNQRMKRKQSSSNNSSNSSSHRVSARNAASKKPSIPKNGRKKVTKSSMKTKAVETKSSAAIVDQVNVRKPKVVQKENNIKRQQPTFRKTKSAANSLPRGSELGGNVNKMFDDAPKTMSDYVERERLRRQNSKKCSSINNKPKQKKPVQSKAVEPKTRTSTKSVTKKMSRLQIRKETKIENQPIGGRITSKPSNSKDLASKRAAYYESLLQNQEI